MPRHEQARSGPPRGYSPSPPAPPSLARFASVGGSGGWLQKSTRTARSITRRGSLAIEDTDPEKKAKDSGHNPGR
jgi:hypothetical protein